MAKKKTAKKPRSINQQLASLERLGRGGFQRTDARFRQVDGRIKLVQLDVRNFRQETNERFAVVEVQIGRLATHVDGFMKLHETMDIEMRVMKEQMKRFEERLGRVEAVQAS